MNPLCCIAPVSIEREKSPNVASNPPGGQSRLGLAKNVGYSSRHSYSAAQVSSISNTAAGPGLDLLAHHEAEDALIGGKDMGAVHGVGLASEAAVAGILYKWVNYGKGWRSRWFQLEDGVLSYYKVHGPDRILMSPGRDKSVKVIGDESVKFVRKNSLGNNKLSVSAKQGKPFGEVHLKVSSVRASKSDDKRLIIFTGTKTLHLRCITKEDRAAWIEALLAAKDLFPKELTKNDVALSQDIVVSTEKLRLRLARESIGETIIKDCESIMMSEVSGLQNQFRALQQKHIELIDTLRQLEVEKIELETTVVDETKRRDSCCG